MARPYGMISVEKGRFIYLAFPSHLSQVLDTLIKASPMQCIEQAQHNTWF